MIHCECAIGKPIRHELHVASTISYISDGFPDAQHRPVDGGCARQTRAREQGLHSVPDTHRLQTPSCLLLSPHKNKSNKR